MPNILASGVQTLSIRQLFGGLGHRCAQLQFLGIGPEELFSSPWRFNRFHISPVTWASKHDARGVESNIFYFVFSLGFMSHCLANSLQRIEDQELFDCSLTSNYWPSQSFLPIKIRRNPKMPGRAGLSKPFKCPQCPKLFAKEATKRNHVLTMHDVRFTNWAKS